MKFNRKICGIVSLIVTLLVGVGVGLWVYFKTRDNFCPSISNKKVLDYDDILTCYRNRQWDRNEAQEIIKNLIDQMQLSSIVDFLKENPEPKFKYNLDVEEDLKKLGTNNYTYDYDFHYSLTKYFKKLQEGHTEYGELMYNSLRFELPISLVPYHDLGGRIRLKVDDYKPNYELVKEWSSRGLTVSKFIGDIVLEIDGKPAIDYIQQYSDEFIGGSRDPNFRFRYALARKMEFSPKVKTFPGVFTINALPPNKKSISVTFEKNGKIELPYLAFNRMYFSEINPSYDFQASFINSNVLPSSGSIKVLPKEEQIPMIFLGEFIKVYNVKDAAVMYIPRFPMDLKSVTTWDNELYEACIALKQSGIKKLLFDMSNNSGGLVDSSYNLLAYFFPNFRDHVYKNYLTNRPQLKELGDLIKTTLKKLSSKSKPNDKIYELKKRNLNSFIQSVDSNKDSKEKRIPLLLNMTIEERLSTMLTDTPPIPLNSIALMSNGVCASACALFSNWIQEMTDIPTYHVGDFLNQPATIGSCIGGTLATLDDPEDEIEEPDALLPFKKIRPYINFRFSLMGFYSLTKPDQALDFTWLPAKNNIKMTEADYDSPINVWSRIIDNIKG